MTEPRHPCTGKRHVEPCSECGYPGSAPTTEVRARHHKDINGVGYERNECAFDRQPYPCDAIRLADDHERLLEAVQEARAILAKRGGYGWTDALDALKAARQP